MSSRRQNTAMGSLSLTNSLDLKAAAAADKKQQLNGGGGGNPALQYLWPRPRRLIERSGQPFVVDTCLRVCLHSGASSGMTCSG